MSTDVPSWTVEVTDLYNSEVQDCEQPVEVVRKSDYDDIRNAKSRRYVFMQDDDSHWYLIEVQRSSLFVSLLSESTMSGDYDRFCEEFDQNRIGTHPSCISFENPIEMSKGKALG